MTISYPTPGSNTISLKTALLASIGSGLEYYDFVIYLFLAPLIGQAFFPDHHPHIAMLETLGIFFLGAVARPFGSYFMGIYADKTGRKASYFAILLVMTLATFLIAICPTYETIGIAAPLLLIVFRLVQCVCFGSDLPTGIILLAEHAPENKKSWYCGLLIMNVALGSSLGTGVNYVLLNLLTTSQMHSFGWRIAFGLGALLNLVGFISRKQLKETHLFVTFQQSLQKISLFKIDIKECLLAMSIVVFPSALVMLQTTFPITLPVLYHLSSQSIYLYLTLFGLIEAILIPLFCALSDCIERRVYYRIAIFIWLLIMPAAFFCLLKSSNTHAIIVFLACYTLLIGILAGAFFILMAEVFSIKTRVRQYALSYNMVYLVMSALPLYVTWLMHIHYWLEGTVGLLIALAMISFSVTYSSFLKSSRIEERWHTF